MTRAEHVAWAKKRELEYLDQGDGANAIASMLSDLGKHPDTEKAQWIGAMIAPFWYGSTSERDVRRWVEGFN